MPRGRRLTARAMARNLNTELIQMKSTSSVPTEHRTALITITDHLMLFTEITFRSENHTKRKHIARAKRVVY